MLLSGGRLLTCGLGTGGGTAQGVETSSDTLTPTVGISERIVAAVMGGVHVAALAERRVYLAGDNTDGQ